MRTNLRLVLRAALLLTLALALTLTSSRLRADTGTCNGASVTLPFTDVPASNIFFCSIAAAFFSGLTNGTSPTTYSPAANVSREQMAAFVTRTLDQSLRRGSRRAALNQWWTTTPQYANGLGTYPVGTGEKHVRSDGDNIWVANLTSDDISAVRASTGADVGLWSGATAASTPLVAMGRVFACGRTNPGSLYMLNPSQPPGPVTTVAANLGNGPVSIAFDGARIWTANLGNSVSIITPAASPPWSVTTVTAGFGSLRGILYDGANIWVTDIGDNTLKKLNAGGGIVQSIAVGNTPVYMIFDGTNIWVPNFDGNSVTVVRVKDTVGNPLPPPPATNAPFVLATLTGNGLNGPLTAAFDGERILVTNRVGNRVSLWKAMELTPIGAFATGGSSDQPGGACSDGLYFWITLDGVDRLARF